MLGLPGGGTLWNAICATTMKRRSILEYTTHKSTFCMLCMHRTLISIRIYIYTYVYMVSCGLHTIIHRYQSDIRYPQQRGPGPLGCFGSWCPQKNSRSMGDEASPERWLEVPKALRLFRYTLRIG